MTGVVGEAAVEKEVVGEAEAVRAGVEMGWRAMEAIVEALVAPAAHVLVRLVVTLEVAATMEAGVMAVVMEAEGKGEVAEVAVARVAAAAVEMATVVATEAEVDAEAYLLGGKVVQAALAGAERVVGPLVVVVRAVAAAAEAVMVEAAEVNWALKATPGVEVVAAGCLLG